MQLATDLRDHLVALAQGYLPNKGQVMSKNEFAQFIRADCRDVVLEQAKRFDGALIAKASCGNGNWADVPWIAIFDPTITTSAQRGFYAVYLFSSNMRQVYLSLNQGTTSVRNEFGNDALNVLRGRASMMRTRIRRSGVDLPYNEINLQSDQLLPKDYEAGHICGFEYDLTAMPADETLKNDLILIMHGYGNLIHAGGIAPSEMIIENGGKGTVAEARQRSASQRIERAKSVRKRVLALRGERCEGCGFTDHRAMGTLGKGPQTVCEVHHMITIAQGFAEGGREYQIPDDFRVLCPTCHAVIHTFSDCTDMERLIRTRSSSERSKEAWDGLY